MYICATVQHSQRLASDPRWGRGYRAGRVSVAECGNDDKDRPCGETNGHVGGELAEIYHLWDRSDRSQNS
jgi:hypothetical protein